MRWYDMEPTVCMGISFIELSPSNRQIECAEHIIKRAQELEPDLDFIRKVTSINIKRRYYKRWYDKNETVSLAFRYLKELPLEAQITICKEIFSMLKNENVPA